MQWVILNDSNNREVPCDVCIARGGAESCIQAIKKKRRSKAEMNDAEIRYQLNRLAIILYRLRIEVERRSRLPVNSPLYLPPYLIASIPSLESFEDYL